MTIGPRVRQLRCTRGWSQGQLAVYAGLCPTTVSMVEIGRVDASARTLAGLAQALEVEVGELFQKIDSTHRNG